MLKLTPTILVEMEEDTEEVSRACFARVKARLGRAPSLDIALYDADEELVRYLTQRIALQQRAAGIRPLAERR